MEPLGLNLPEAKEVAEVSGKAREAYWLVGLEWRLAWDQRFASGLFLLHESQKQFGLGVRKHP